jgi:hypothetical protein
VQQGVTVVQAQAQAHLQAEALQQFLAVAVVAVEQHREPAQTAAATEQTQAQPEAAQQAAAAVVAVLTQVHPVQAQAVSFT